MEDLSISIEQLYHQLKENKQIQEILQCIEQKYPWANKDHCFYLLFSYDYLYITHEFIKEVLTLKNTIHYDFLCSTIKM